MSKRFPENPLILTSDIMPSTEGMKVECVLNPGAFRFDSKIWLLLRVAERPIQREGFVSFPIQDDQGAIEILTFSDTDPDLDQSDARMVTYKGINYLSTLSHLRLVCSDDGKKFYEPTDRPTKIFGQGALETYGIEDCRVCYMEDQFLLTYTKVSAFGVGVGLIATTDWRTFERHGMIIPPHNKDCALFDEKINDKYYCLHRPSGIDLGGNFIWMAESLDLMHWGNHTCVLQTRPGMWDSVRVGAGASPIKTAEGWLEIYHGADHTHRYCLGAVLFDLQEPTVVLARSEAPILEPTAPYELVGFFGNVVFTNGHIVDGDRLSVYYGASDEVICGAEFSIAAILSTLLKQSV